jgi:hypothetical protein
MKNIYFSFFFLLIGTMLFAQKDFSYFIGIQPSVTKEPFYEAKEFDVNIVPLAFQVPLNKKMDIRLTSLFNYHFGPQNQISDVGFELATPFYFSKKEHKYAFSKGFQLAPVLNFGRNFLNEHNTLTLAVEPGYFFLFDRGFALGVNLQLGGSYFMYSGDENIWRQHLGVKVNLGLWNLFDRL